MQVTYPEVQHVREEESREGRAPAHARPEPLNLPYPVTLVRDEHDVEDRWIATVDALAGCSARGRTPEEALDGVSNALAEWIEAAKREGRDVPDPKSLQSHSGRLLLRMPQTLHAELTRVAERESVSLNQFITDVLAGALGWRVPPRAGRIAVTPPAQAIRPRTISDDDQQLIAEQVPPTKQSTRFLTATLVVNFVVVALAAIVAIIVLIAAWL
jgi:antitoxin HicB